MTRETVRTELRALYDRLEQASLDGDIASAVRAVYSPSIVVAGQDAPTVRSLDELTVALQQLIGNGRLKITPMFDGPTDSGDTAFDFVLNEVSISGSDEVLVGKSLMVWRRGPQGWRCVADMFAMGRY